MAVVTLFFKAINKDESVASSFLSRERGHMLKTVKRPARRPRKRKPSAETPPVPNIDRASEILPSLSDDVGQEAKRIDANIIMMKQKMHVVMHADRTCLARSNYTNKHPPPNIGTHETYTKLFPLYALWPWNYFFVAPILEIIRYMYYIT